jgi:hypothetical protein
MKTSKLAKILPILATVSLGVLFFFPATAHAANTIRDGVNSFGQAIGLGNPDIRTIAARLIKTALSLLGIILLLMFLWGGFLFMTSGGDDEQRSKAKSTILNAIIGLVIILTANSIVVYVIGALTTATNAAGN